MSNNLILCLAKKYKENENFEKILNIEIKKEIKKLNSNKLTKYTSIEENKIYFFNPYNIFFFINNKTLVTQPIKNALTNLNIMYEDFDKNKIFIPNRFNVITNNLETNEKIINKKIWLFSTKMLKIKKSKIKKSINDLTKYQNISKLYKTSDTNINIYELSYMMYFSRPEIFFPIDKSIIKLLKEYKNYLIKEKENNYIININKYLKFCLKNKEKLNINLLIEVSKDNNNLKKINEKEKINLLYFLNKQIK